MGRTWMMRLILVFAVACVYGRTVGHEFVAWDDPSLIYQNPNLNPPTPHGLWNQWRRPDSNLYVPIVYTAWWGLARVAWTDEPDESGLYLNPYVFHAANVAAHALAALTVLEILRLLVGDGWPAVAGAMLFAVHPVQAEPVAWATGMKDVLSGLLALVALHQYLVAARAPEDGRGRRRLHYAIATVVFAAALLAKPSVVVLPLIAGVLDALVVRRPVRTVAAWAGPWAALSAVAAGVAVLAQPAVGVDAGPLWARPLIVADALAFYLYKLAWPVWLGIDYGRTPRAVIANGWVWWTWVAPAAVAAAVAWARKPWLTAAALVFAIAVAPVSGLTAFVFQFHSTTADRYLYLAMLGPALALSAALARVPPRWARPASLATLLLLLALSAGSALQADTWADSQRLYEHALWVNPTSLAGHNGIGSIDLARRQYREAAEEFAAALRTSPDDPVSHVNMGYAMLALRRPADAAAQFRLAMKTRDDATIHNSLATALYGCRDYAGAAVEMRAALARMGEDAKPADLARVHTNIGDLLAKQGDAAGAAAAYREALELDPTMMPAREGLSRLGAATQAVR